MPPRSSFTLARARSSLSRSPLSFALLALPVMLTLGGCKKAAEPAAAEQPVAAEGHAAAPGHGDHAHGGHAPPQGTHFTCPMHPEVLTQTAGKCPKCGMDLIAVNAQGAKNKFDVLVSAEPEPVAGKPTKLTFDIIVEDTVLKGIKRVFSLDVVHEKPLHLLMMSKDLSWFAHEHPERQTDGTFSLDFTFPHGGEHILFMDFRPTNAAGQVVSKPLVVKGQAAAPVALQADDLDKAKTVAGHQVRLKPSSLHAGEDVRLDFLLVKDGKPVTDLDNYLGAKGHAVIVSADGKEFLHSHPDDHAEHAHAAEEGAHAHPKLPGQVTFQTRFPRPGLYKAWGQFLHKGEMVIADFVLDIAPPRAAGGAAGAVTQ